MQEESAQKLTGGNRHLPLLITMGIIFPTERDLICGHGDQPVIGDGHTMGVASQVMEYMLGSPEGLLGVHHPVFRK